MKTVVDLFAGCGGMSLGLEMAGFKTIYVNELHPDAMSTFLSNRPKSDLNQPANHSFDLTKISKSTKARAKLAGYLKKKYGDIDLVVGGPPCQGYSGIGHRRSFRLDKIEIPTNHLYRDMAKVIADISPRAFIFENVRGLLNAKWTRDGEKGEIWSDVLRTFNKVKTRRGSKEYGYVIQWKLLHAKDFGVPQSRPRIILIGIREDVYVKNLQKIEKNGYFPTSTTIAPHPVDVLSDLADPNWKNSHVTNRYIREPRNDIQRYFRKKRYGSQILQKGSPVSEQEYSRHNPEITKKFALMIKNKGKLPNKYRTKKFAQRVLPKRWSSIGPTITIASLPDDFIHYSLPRTLTVREWARFQTFPDWYVFQGKRTTGGRRRAGDPDQDDWHRELPKYTQIGNAVPVLLAKALGKHLKKII